ncbi:MAG: gliding motility-associated C-terminal domain-containing protein [Bacteroidota bacterium]
MIEKDNIQELFSKSLGNHTAPVRPELWNGLQAKMAAAGVSSVAATKGVSLLAKWIIGSAAVATTAVVTTVAILNSNEETKQPKAPTQEQISTPAVTDPSVAESTTPLASVDNNAATNLVLKPDGSNMYPVGPVPYVVNLDMPLIQERITSNELPLVSATLVPKNTEPADVEVIGIPEGTNETTPADEVAPSTVVKNDEASIEFPNVFTPSVQDNANDEYFIKCKNIASIHVIIQNTENRLVYETTDLNFKWNGRINGTEDFVEKGTYACIAVYQDLSGKTHKKIILIDVR